MKIICIGLNYINHARELKLPLPDVPLFFLKPETSLVTGNNPFPYPDFSKDVHYETELVIKISAVAKNIAAERAHEYYNEITLGLDMTARDLQREAMEKGLPWEPSKAFDFAAPVGLFNPLEYYNNINNLEFNLLVNGKLRQKGNSSDLIFGFNDIVSYLSKFITLYPGDLIFTGTPTGVGAVSKGDVLEAFLAGEKLLHCEVV